MKNIVEDYEFNLVSMQYSDKQFLDLLKENQTYAALLIDMNPALGLVPNVRNGQISYMRDGKEIDANMAHRSLMAYRHVLRALESGEDIELQKAYGLAKMVDLPEQVQGRLKNSLSRIERYKNREVDNAILRGGKALYALHTGDVYRSDAEIAGLDHVLEQSDLEQMGFPQRPGLLQKLFSLPKQDKKPAYVR